ncbi:hypothetical protein OEZ85_004606 [Tetradesmus obliquus]|uniref:ELYS-like domain-containing protein n=1 Tax=Tetradesmus obliquus TaxID=3088 RepID=A0ABY8UM09_TETOB|nr:hypothetical protein OEZ85_004606 [Tetradesmus obliquus]
MALRLQQALVDSPLTSLKSESVRSFIGVLAQRFGLQALLDGDLQQQFYGLLTAIFEANLGWFICDYVAIVCNDKDFSSADPEEWQLLQPAAVLGWCTATASELHKRVLGLFQSGASPDSIIELAHATKTLLSVAGALQSTLPPCSTSSRSAQELLSTLQLLQQTTQVLGWLEQQQQQRPGQPSLISRSASSSGFLQAGGSQLAGLSCKPCPAHDSLPAWQASLAGKRSAAPRQRLFLDDLADQLLVTSEGQRQLAYPYPDVVGCVEGLFMSGGCGAAAWRAKLALLLYYLLDGGWLASAVAFAHGFQLPLTLVQQWQCHYLMDCALQQQQQQGCSSSSSSSSSAALDEACNLLGAVACPSTPFRFVEALLAAGRPTTALAVQRARCATTSSSSASSANGLQLSLREAQVLLRVQLGCGLLAEAFSELRRHCSQLHPSKRTSNVRALVQQLAAWATADDQQQQQQQSRLQQLLQLPLDADEESALLAWFRGRMAAGQSGGHVLPLYLLQVRVRLISVL